MQNWETKKLKDICEKGSSNVNMKDLDKMQGDYPIYGASGFIQNVNFYHQENEYIGIIKDGSGIGRTMLLPPKSSVIGTIQYILPKEGNSIRFIDYALQSLDLSEYKQGAAIPHIYFRDYGETELVVPPLEEQKRIVKILDEKFAMLETVKANAKTNLQNAKDLFQSQLTKAFCNSTWEKKTVLEVCTNIVDCPHKTPKKVNNKTDFPCIRTSELKDGFIFWDSMQYLDEEEYKKRVARLQPQENDIVFGREGSVGGAILIPHEFHFSLGQRTMLLRPNQNIIYPKYFLQVIISDFFRKQIREKITPGGVPHINVADVKSLNVLLPPLPEQKLIVEQLDSLSEKVRSLEEIYTKQLANCDELKQAFLAKAFNGEL